METLYIILGWLLGILSPSIMSRISDKYKKKNFQKIITNELKDLKKRFALIPIMIYPRYGKLNEEILNWVMIQTNNFKELDVNEDRKKEIEKYVNSKENLKKLIDVYNLAEQKDKPAFNFKKMITSAIDSNLANFGLLEDKFSEKLLEVKFQINVFNEEVQCVNDYLKMTFDSNISDTNHKIISKEIENKNIVIAEKAMLTVEKINDTINLK